MSKRCLGCMKIKENSPVCEHCGYNENVPNYSHQLPVGTVLRGQYLVGKVLGQGGFGITYMGWDLSLEAPVAIKEYYPNSYVNRDCNQSLDVVCAGEGMEDLFRYNRERFLREARILAKLSSVPGIVRVSSLFSEHNTAYIIMEYVEGIDLKRYIRIQNRVLTVAEAFAVLRPIMDALEKVHAAELVHRDISPDNIMIQPDGSAKLLDFGAAREVEHAEVDKELPQSTEAILKHGFAPMEQYRRRGSLGPWTDVYALCATLYYCLTGKVPNSAPERILGDDNVNWNQIPGLTSQQIAALEKGLELVPENRTRTIGELRRGLFTQTQQPTVSKPATPKTKPVDYPTNTVPLEEKAAAPVVMETKKKKRRPLGLLAAVLAVAAVAVGVFALKNRDDNITVDIPESIPTATEIVEGTEPVALTQEQLEYQVAEALEKAGEYGRAAIAFGKLGDYADARERSFALWDKVAQRDTIAAGGGHIVALKNDGTVLADGTNRNGQCNVAGSSDIVAVDAGTYYTAVLKSDGTVITSGENIGGVSWSDIVAISAAPTRLVGLKSDGTVLTAGDHVQDYDTSGWTDIIAISASYNKTMGLKSDGTVVIASREDDNIAQVDWTDIVSISSSAYHGFGLKADGTVEAMGWNDNYVASVSQWTDIVQVCGNYVEQGVYIIGLKSDGTLVAQGTSLLGSVMSWKDIVALEVQQSNSQSAKKTILGLKSDGTLLVDSRIWDAYDVSGWRDIKLPTKSPSAPNGNETAVEAPTAVPSGNEEAYAAAEELLAKGETAKAAIAFGKLGDYEDARERSFELWAEVAQRDTVSASTNHTVALANDGTVVATGRNVNSKGVFISGGLGPCDVANWTDIVAVSAGLYHTVGLKADGTVVAIGDNHDDQCEVADWTDIVAISAGSEYTLGLKSDGTVVCTNGESAVNWQDVVAISSLRSSAGLFRIAGVKADSTVISNYSDTTSWTDIVSVAVGPNHIIGLKKDGTVVAAGSNRSGQCDVEGWTDIVAIDASGGQTSTSAGRTVGLKKDGTVVATGFNSDVSWHDVSDWTAVAAISTSGDHTVAVRHDGSVVAVGNRSYGRCDVDGWADIMLPQLLIN